MTDLENYAGSRLLEGLSGYTSLNVDQLNFIVSQLVALGLAGLYRTVLGPAKVSPKVRHIFGLLFGIWMSYFCFGYQALHLAGLPAVCYLVLLTQKPSIMHGAVLFTAMLYLSVVHLHRQFLEDSSFGLDISGPLMVITQKVTSLAFSLHDGLKDEEEMTETQKHYALKKMPSLLEFFSYSLMFPSIMAGPAIFYKDYIDFIEGNSIATYKKPAQSSKTIVVRDPSPLRAVCQKMTLALICALVFVLFLPRFPISRVKEQNFIENTTFSYKFWYLTVATSLVRAKYYFAWTLADAICNNAGLGWDGETWSKFSNVDIFHFEFGTSLKQSIDSWNKGTNSWLRFIVYKRVTNYSTLSTFVLSAIWHGFYPGYYLTFLSGALFTFAARSMRRLLRPYFITTNESKLLYDLITFSVTRFVMAYITFTFVLLEFRSSIVIYDKLYWVWHVLALLAIYVAPQIIPKAQLNHKNGIAMALSKAGPYSDAMGKID
ncbi:unnamed protein product [Ceutorhynchus assimilis]|uniref:Lysophospholipid acyltransferase 1 n=1 Tax=Ceutorhynchus assimilis TaxID=467358 RepID=A0A9N9N0T1_9CUCU|nr:unnamed protein product [Ceutorhynchus assimilis]